MLVAGAMALSTCIFPGEPESVSQEVMSVTLEPGAWELSSLGDTIKLRAYTWDADGKFVEGAGRSWSSSAEDVATVDRWGVVTAVGNGIAWIRVTSGAVADSAQVTVEQVVYQVQVTPEQVVLAVLGDTVPLQAVALDANDSIVQGAVIAWSSTAEAAATVDGAGLVTAVGDGTVWIRATTGYRTDSALVWVGRDAWVSVSGRVTGPEGYPLSGLVAHAKLGDSRDTTAIEDSATFELAVLRCPGSDSVWVTIDAEPGTVRLFHPSLLFLPARGPLPLDPITVVLAPRRWHVNGGVYDGQEVDVSLNEVYSTTDGRHRFWGESGVTQHWPQYWEVAPEFPIPVVFAHDITDVPITTTDSTYFWSYLSGLSQQLGEPVFEPASYLGIGAREAERYVWVDTTSGGTVAGMYGVITDTTARVRILQYSGVRFERTNHPMFMLRAMVGTLGAGYTCAWDGLMTHCTQISGSLSVKDVAVIQLMTAMGRLQQLERTPYGIGEAIQGERAEIMRTDFLPCPWAYGAPDFGEQGRISCEVTP
jgi:hypothetical protein